MTKEPAQTSAATLAKAGTGKYLTFSIGQESYGIEILKVREIIRLPEITLVPQMPDYVKGVINLRGKVIPVIDLRVKFQFPKAEFNERTCLIVVSVKLAAIENALVGLIVDVVEEVININAQDIEPAPDFGTKLDTEYILGMAMIKGAVKTILDIGQVVTAETIKAASGKTEQNQPAPVSP
ncbi:MAG: purine-binding chemotaxis protein CheW [Verrucomicrobia bacterium]|nr:purine-binding chemotaxis protein CheW [Verrucomicrobiota bacterium]